MIALLLACQAPSSPLTAPSLPPVMPDPGPCPLAVVPRDLGGVWHGAASTAAFSAVGAADRIVRSDGLTARFPGQVAALAAEGETLWAGLSHGIGRLTPDGQTFWWTGGQITGIALAEGHLWAADAQGRLLVLPTDASEGARPLSVEIDGYPVDLTGAEGGVLLSTRSARWHLSLAEGAVAVRRAEGVGGLLAGPAQVQDRQLTVSGTTTAIDSRVNRLAWSDGRAFIAAEDRLLTWDGTLSPLSLPGLTDQTGFSGESLSGHGDRLAAAGGVAGASLEGRLLPGGRLTHLTPWRGGLAVSRSTGEAGHLLLLDADLAQTAAHPLRAPITALLAHDDDLLVASAGLWRLDDSGLHRLTAEVTDLIDLALLDGSVLALSAERGVLRLTEAGLAPLRGPTDPPSLRLGTWRGGAVTATGFFGRLHADTTILSLPTPIHDLMTAQTGSLRSHGDDLLAALPTGGLVRLDADGSVSFLAAPPALDVVPWSGGLAVAAGTEGVTLLGQHTTRCALPGRIHRLAVLGEDLLALSQGTLYRLSPP